MLTVRASIVDRPGLRLVLEWDTLPLPPLTMAYLRRIDAIREALAAGSLCPDDAHAALLDCRWIGKLAAGGVATGMRALR
jgi:hypothetical protein